MVKRAVLAQREARVRDEEGEESKLKNGRRKK
ncbi:hypothetical protein COLO4_02920 [Corchorus olitorius]|uniref:Uncharacterized protein n=1 Tax=Corchorus olitorius TaxID=93759 RepID=A0A1R3L019_9ROSI|nr:hypothetical protein COLO4_02920 [Corchorus olitorius]